MCVKAVCDQLDYDVNGTASWQNGDRGFCETYALMLSQILSAANLPNLQVTGGNHAWVQVYLPDEGQWYVMDGVATDAGRRALFTFAEYEAECGYSQSYNNTDSYKVARALVELFF